MKRIKRLGTLIAAAIIGMTGAAIVAPAANAAIYSPGVFSVPYNGDLYAVESSGAIEKLSYERWRSLGSPAPRPAPTDFVKYSWSSAIYAVTYFGDAESEWVWDTIDVVEWGRAGFPYPRTVGWVPGTYLYSWSTSPEIFAIAPNGEYRKLNYVDWVITGSRTPDNRSNEGFFKYSWTETIVRMTNIAGGQGRGLSFQEWHAEVLPTPRVVSRVPGDTVYKNYRDDRIWYAGPAFNRVLTFDEWRTMGFPAPEQRTPARPTDARNCDSFGGSWRAAQDLFEYWYPIHGDVYGLDGNKDGIACNALRGS